MTTVQAQDILKTQRALGKTKERDIDSILLSMTLDEKRWIISTFLQSFLPHLSKITNNPTVNQVRLEKLNNIPKNQLDQSVLIKLNESITQKYFNEISRNNPTSACILLKTIPKPLISTIISFLPNKERYKCCSVSWDFNDACNEPIAKNTLALSTDKTLKLSVLQRVNIYNFYNFKNLKICCDQGGHIEKFGSFFNQLFSHSPTLTSIDRDYRHDITSNHKQQFVTDDAIFNAINIDESKRRPNNITKLSWKLQIARPAWDESQECSSML